MFLGGILLVIVFVVGFMLGRFSFSDKTLIDNSNKNTTSESADASTEDTTTIPSSSLSDGQKKMLSTMGIDPESFVVTPEMVACAEASLGSARVLEIQNGDTPSFTEGVKLAACYK